jgi:hypothetical protein
MMMYYVFDRAEETHEREKYNEIERRKREIDERRTSCNGAG